MRLKQYIRKADIILFIVLVAVGLAASAALAMHQSESAASTVVIRSGGKFYVSYPLNKDTKLVIPAPSGTVYDSPSHHALTEDDECTEYTYYNVVTIKDGKVSVTGSSCKNQVCIRRGEISMPGETIVCLPNRLVVSIGDDEGGGYDSITS